MRSTIFVPDGYNGHMIEIFTDRILEETDNAIKFQVAEKGKEYMVKWVWKKDLPK
jgi:hypothetical protein